MCNIRRYVQNEMGSKKAPMSGFFDPNTNTPKITSAPGYSNYTIKAVVIQCLTITENLHHTVAFSSDLIYLTTINKSINENIGEFMNMENKKIAEVPYGLHTSSLTAQCELLRWCYRLGRSG